MITHDRLDDLFVRRCQGSRPTGTLVYVHGLGESGLCFERLIQDPRLRSWDHLVPDLCGYGKSPWREPPFALQEHADCLLRWIGQRCPSNVMLVGHSMGGVVGTMMCEQRPDLFAGFINVEGNISGGDCTFSGQAAAQSEQSFVQTGCEALCEAVYSGGGSVPVLRSYYASLRMCDPRALYRNSLELVELSRDEQLARRLSDLQVPHLYLLGHPRGGDARSRQLLSEAGARWIKIEDAGHWPFADQQHIFVDQVLRFLARME